MPGRYKSNASIETTNKDRNGLMLGTLNSSLQTSICTIAPGGLDKLESGAPSTVDSVSVYLGLTTEMAPAIS